MLSSIVLALAAASPRGDASELPDFDATLWWNSIPLTLEQLRGRAVFVESFRTW